MFCVIYIVFFSCSCNTFVRFSCRENNNGILCSLSTVLFDYVLQLMIISGDGFGNQSYLMVHLLTLANLLIQFRHKKTTPLPFLNVFTIEECVVCTVN